VGAVEARLDAAPDRSAVQSCPHLSPRHLRQDWWHPTAVADEIIAASPCRIRGASATRTRHQPRVASLGELERIVEAMPDRYRALVLLAAWCGLRLGELTELRRADVDVAAGVVHVRRAVTRAGGVGEPKSVAGRRTVSIPPHVVPVVDAHLRTHVAADPGALLFPAQTAATSPRRRCRSRGIRPVTRRVDRISTFTTCGTPERPSQRPQGPRWRT